MGQYLGDITMVCLTGTRIAAEPAISVRLFYISASLKAYKK